MEARDHDRGSLGPSQEPQALSLTAMARAVRTREDLATFVWALDQDRLDHSEEWENPTLDRYLPALASFVEDVDGLHLNRGEPVPAVPSWRFVAELLLAAKVYE